MRVIATTRVQPRPRGLWARIAPGTRVTRRIVASMLWPLLLLLGRTGGAVAIGLALALAGVFAQPVVMRLAGDLRARRAVASPPDPSAADLQRSADLAFARVLAPRLAAGALALIIAVDPSLLGQQDRGGVLDRLYGVGLLCLLVAQLMDPHRLWRDARAALAVGEPPPLAFARVVGEVDGEPVLDVPDVGRVVLTDGTSAVRHLMQDDAVLLAGALSRRNAVVVTAARGTGWARVRRILTEEG